MAAQWVVVGLGILVLLGGIGGGVPAAAAIGLILLIGGLLWAVSAAPKCPLCHWPWTIRKVSSQVVGQERAFGLVTRTRRRYGTKSSSVTYRQVRVPTINSTIREDYVCSHCRKPSFKQFVRSQEDFSPRRAAQGASLVVNVNAPTSSKPQTYLHCRYCGALNPSENVGAGMHCTSCGAVL
jgi:hypothetical protein